MLSTQVRQTPRHEPSDATVDAGTQNVAASLTEVIREAGLQAGAAVVIGLPGEKVFFSRLKTEQVKPDDVRRLLKFELEDDFPLPFDDLVADICSRRPGQGACEYLIAAVSRGVIGSWVQAATEGGRPCSALSTGVCALAAAANLVEEKDGDPRMLLYADGRRAILGLVQDGAVTCARHLSCTGDPAALADVLARELELTFRGTPGGQYQRPLKIVLSGPDELTRELAGKLSKASGREVVRLEPPVPVEGQFAVALGLALIGLRPADGNLNFLNADLSQVDRAARSKAKRAAMISVGLVAVIVALLGLQTIGRLRALGSERARLTQEIRSVFVKSFPAEKKIVNELAQMTEHVNALRKERDTLVAIVGKRIQPLRVLHILSERMTADKGISIVSFSAKDRTVRVDGTGGSFESVEQFLNELRQVPDFASVEMENAALSRGSDRPAFRLLISLKVD